MCWCSYQGYVRCARWWVAWFGGVALQRRVMDDTLQKDVLKRPTMRSSFAQKTMLGPNCLYLMLFPMFQLEATVELCSLPVWD